MKYGWIVIAAFVTSVAHASGVDRCPPAPDQPPIDLTGGAALRRADPKVRYEPAIENALGQAAVLQRLLNQGADPNTCIRGGSLLSLSASMGDAAQMRMLLKAGASPDAPRDEVGGTPLHAALALGRFAAAHVLIDYNASATASDDAGATPLHLLASAASTEGTERAQQVELARRLVAKGALVDAADQRGITPLMLATTRRNRDLVAWLLHRGADPMLVDAKDKTSVSRAQQMGDSVLTAMFERESYLRPIRSGRVAEFLAKLGECRSAEFPARANELLMPVLMLGDVAATQALVACGANLNRIERIEIDGVASEMTPLVFAAGELGSAKLVAALVEGGAAMDMPATSSGGASSFTALSAALSTGNLEAATYLIERGANLDAADSRNGMTPLMRAVSGSDTEEHRRLLPVVQLLLKRGATVNQKSRDGMTALHMASIAGDAQAVRLLLQHGADAGLRDKNKKTALDYARKVRAREAATVLASVTPKP